MARSENKVQFNIKNVHYAKMTTQGEAPAWATPVAVPGAKSLTLDASGEIKPYYADGIVYYQSVSNKGYEGDLEMTRFPDQMLQDIWNVALVETDKVLIETASGQVTPFALLFEIDGDTDQQLYCLYNCTGTRPGIGGKTTEGSDDPETKSSTIAAVPLENNRVLARTTATTPEEVRTNWFKSVYVPA